MVAAVPTTQPQMEDPQSVTTSPLSQPAVRQVNTADGTVTQVSILNNTGNDRYSGHRYSGIDRYSGTKNPDDAILTDD